MRSGIYGIIIAMVWCAQAFGYDWSTNPGDGSPENPYQISMPNQLLSIGNDPVLVTRHFILTSDINLAGLGNNPDGSFSKSIIAYDVGTLSYTFQGLPFTGYFDGDGHIIRNLAITSTGEFIGLFGQIGNSAIVTRIGLENCVINGGIATGALCGSNWGGIISKCYIQGTVTGTKYSGGLCGEVENISSNGTILIGTLTDCYAKGTFTSNGCYSGAICGQNNGRIQHCFSVMASSGSCRHGAFCGYNGGGGLITDSYWDIDVSGQIYSFGGMGLNTSDMQSMEPYQLSGWDNGNWKIAPNDYPRLEWENVPGQLIAQAPAPFQGDGTSHSPYKIDSLEAFQKFRIASRFFDSHFLLTTNLDLDNAGRDPDGSFVDVIVSSPFNGVFDGGGHTLSNMKILAIQPCLGLFRSLESDSKVCNLNLDTYNIHRSDITSDNIGGITAKLNGGTIENCHVSGIIDVESYNGYLGGICGENFQGTIQRCSAIVSISYSYVIGGISSVNDDGVLSNCYAMFNTAPDTGYLCQINFGGIIENSYITGIHNVLLCDFNSGVIDSCYFLNTGLDNGYGTPFDEADMMIQTNFAGWDFVGESANGDNEIWRMCADGVDYPRLSWEFARNGDFACGDGVDLADLQALALHWLTAAELTPTTFNYACDANGDESIDFYDFKALSENWP